ncbi:hypothetical protein GJ744_008611 [Endocarpon pusillum]|uniref:Vacuolar ATPase assembly protein VMA22 n=1 Tax=Endocarpon pusillum TaxID=364733 RepID=A0A8H7E4C0_9EURO|nr:hypothetical protein GJ744_008611 [Endocarpon pusillum]
MSNPAALPTPPGSSSSSSSSPSATNAPEASDAISRLDALLEIYLDRLDRYQRLREELSQNFSAGFLSLAYANRSGNLGSGRRYGEEGYDARMKAGRRVRIQTKPGKAADLVGGAGACRKKKHVEEGADQRGPHSSGGGGGGGGGTIRYTTEQLIPSCEDDAEDETAHSPVVPYEMTAAQKAFISPPRDEKPSSSTTGPAADADTNTNTNNTRLPPPPLTPASSSLSSTQPPPPPPPPPNHTTNSSQQQPRSKSKSKSSKSKTKKAVNPLNWYGVLVPASLRAAQTSFACAIQGPIPQLVNIQLEMRDLECQIRKIRAEAGLTRLTGQDVE